MSRTILGRLFPFYIYVNCSFYIEHFEGQRCSRQWDHSRSSALIRNYQVCVIADQTFRLMTLPMQWASAVSMHHSSASCGCRTPECLDGFCNSSNPLAEVGVCSVSLCTQYTTFAVITKESGCLGDVNVSIKVVIITSQIFTFNKLIDALFDGWNDDLWHVLNLTF